MGSVHKYTHSRLRPKERDENPNGLEPAAGSLVKADRLQQLELALQSQKVASSDFPPCDAARSVKRIWSGSDDSQT